MLTQAWNFLQRRGHAGAVPRQRHTCLGELQRLNEMLDLTTCTSKDTVAGEKFAFTRSGIHFTWQPGGYIEKCMRAGRFLVTARKDVVCDMVQGAPY